MSSTQRWLTQTFTCSKPWTDENRSNIKWLVAAISNGAVKHTDSVTQHLAARGILMTTSSQLAN